MLDDFGYDDFIYGGGDDVLVGGAGYDSYYFGRGGGHDYIIDGNGPDEFGYSNGLALFQGFSDDFEIDVSKPEVTSSDVQFTNHGDGKWTIAFANGDGAVTFAANEISDISLFSYSNPGGPADSVTLYAYNSADNTYDLMFDP
ncbi:MAG: hypothetical protein FJX53_09330 [Alphaproteobacteria bacterium]|nr:hypothetical protein [Alphaproteobacteria bacterium]